MCSLCQDSEEIEARAARLFANSEHEFARSNSQISSTAHLLWRLGVVALLIAWCLLVWGTLLWLGWVLVFEDPLW